MKTIRLEKLSRRETGDGDGKNTDLKLKNFSFRSSPTIQTIEEIYLYTGSDLLADIGGYLGLLLGVSAFTVYTAFEDFLRAFKCSERCRCHHEAEEKENES